MDIKAILAKVLKGETLTDEEKTALAGYNPEDSGKIPLSRLNEVIAARDAAEAEATSLKASLQTLTSKVEELESKGMSEADKAKKAYEKTISTLQEQVKTLTGERDAATGNLGKLERASKISKLAGEHSFSDADYLDYLVSSANVDVDSKDAVSAFMSNLGKSRPELFKSSAKPGGDTKPGMPPKDSDDDTRMKELMGKPSLTLREAAEVLSLQNKSKEKTGV
ncbi:MAG: hypothetical protein AB7F40_04390 [Victivallaceae bacterium]